MLDAQVAKCPGHANPQMSATCLGATDHNSPHQNCAQDTAPGLDYVDPSWGQQFGAIHRAVIKGNLLDLQAVVKKSTLKGSKTAGLLHESSSDVLLDNLVVGGNLYSPSDALVPTSPLYSSPAASVSPSAVHSPGTEGDVKLTITEPIREAG